MGRFHGTDIALLPGDSWALRRSADEIRSTVTELATARIAAVHVEEITRGDHWRGEAFDAFRQVVSRDPLSPAIDHATARMHEAADQLAWFADRFDHLQSELRWCRSRHRALVAALEQAEAAAAASPDVAAYHDTRAAELAAQIAAVRHRADAAWRDHDWAVEVVRDTFDRLDDQPRFAAPPPSALERVGGAALSFVEGVAGTLWSGTIGLAEGTRDLVVGLVEVAELLNPLMAPFRLRDAWNDREQIVAVLEHAWNNPGEFFGELGTAMLDLDMLFEDPARWVGRRIPDILLTVATGGMGRIGTTAASSVRALRGAQIADRTVSRVGLVSRVANVASSTADEAIHAMSSSRTILQRVSSVGADTSRMERAGGLASLTRTDTAIGRLATRFDQLGPAAQLGRQVPGLLNEEIRGFTSIPRRMLDDLLPTNRFGEAAGNVLDHPTVAGAIDAHLSGGLTSQLGLVDGLLNGAPALSPEVLTGMAGLAGVDVLDRVAGVQGLLGDIGAASHLQEAS